MPNVNNTENFLECSEPKCLTPQEDLIRWEDAMVWGGIPEWSKTNERIMIHPSCAAQFIQMVTKATKKITVKDSLERIMTVINKDNEGNLKTAPEPTSTLNQHKKYRGRKPGSKNKPKI